MAGVAEFDTVKVFTATMQKDRAALGEEVTSWLRSSKAVVVDKIVSQSSDNAFHCLSITLFCNMPNGNGGAKR
jgi:hypothetical protein